MVFCQIDKGLLTTSRSIASEGLASLQIRLGCHDGGVGCDLWQTYFKSAVETVELRSRALLLQQVSCDYAA